MAKTMAPSEQMVPLSYQEVLDRLSQAASTNGDSFRIKVLRRPHAASLNTVHVATFGDATWTMIANAESWLAPFAGGGLYVLQIYDGRDQRTQHGTLTPSEVPGPAREPDPRVTRAAGWIGPVLIEGAPSTGPIPLFSGMPSLAVSPGQVPRTPSPDAGLGGLFDYQQRANEDLRRREIELEERARRVELDALRRGADERAAHLETQLKDLRESLSSRASTSLPEVLSGLAALLAPVLTPIFQSMAEGRRERLELEKARLERESKLAEEAKGKPLIDPAFMELLDRQTRRAEEQVTQFSNLMKLQAESAKTNMESQSVAQRAMIQTITDIAQLQLKVQGGSESGVDWGKLVGGALSGLAMLKGMNQTSGQPGQPTATPAQPGQSPIPTPTLAGNGTAGGNPVMPEVDPSPELDRIEDRVRAKEPPAELVSDLKKALETPASKAEVAAEGGLLEVFEARLGDFAGQPLNQPYMGALIEELTKQGVLPAE